LLAMLALLRAALPTNFRTVRSFYFAGKLQHRKKSCYRFDIDDVLSCSFIV